MSSNCYFCQRKLSLSSNYYSSTENAHDSVLNCCIKCHLELSTDSDDDSDVDFFKNMTLIKRNLNRHIVNVSKNKKNSVLMSMLNLKK